MYTIKKAYISSSGLSIGYKKKATSLYKNLSFELYKGELVCLLGANGAGKSTLLRTISRSQSATDGTIFIGDKDINVYTEKELSHILGLVLTDKISAGGFTVRELVELGRYPYTGFFGQLSKADKEIAQKAMEDVGISHKADSYVAELSDGEKQKAMIAKSLTQECPIVLLDEPTAFLDVESRMEIMNLLRSLAVEQNKVILLSTHDIDIALLLADKLWLLSRKSGLKCGVTEDLVTSGELDYFFGTDKIYFNKETGQFLPNQKKNKRVIIESEKYLYHWTQNLLAKFGFYEVQDRTGKTLVVNSKSPTDINVYLGENIYKFSSFGELAGWLHSYE